VCGSIPEAVQIAQHQRLVFVQGVELAFADADALFIAIVVAFTRSTDSTCLLENDRFQRHFEGIVEE